jgi:hypothetical protein
MSDKIWICTECGEIHEGLEIRDDLKSPQHPHIMSYIGPGTLTPISMGIIRALAKRVLYLEDRLKRRECPTQQ